MCWAVVATGWQRLVPSFIRDDSAELPHVILGTMPRDGFDCSQSSPRPTYRDSQAWRGPRGALIHPLPLKPAWKLDPELIPESSARGRQRPPAPAPSKLHDEFPPGTNHPPTTQGRQTAPNCTTAPSWKLQPQLGPFPPSLLPCGSAHLLFPSPLPICPPLPSLFLSLSLSLTHSLSSTPASSISLLLDTL